MTTKVDATCASISHTLPLCCQYFAVLFQPLALQVRGEGDAGGQPVHWALGVLADGQCEVMGVWPEPESGASAWQATYGDLTARGVERIRFVVMPGSAGLDVAFPGATMLNSAAPLLPLVVRFARARGAGSDLEATAKHNPRVDALPVGRAVPRALNPHPGCGGPIALSPRLRQVVARADEAARQLQARLDRALRRHGRFDSADSAVTFIEQELNRLARGPDLTPPVSAGVLARRVAGAAALAGMRATGA